MYAKCTLSALACAQFLLPFSALASTILATSELNAEFGLERDWKPCNNYRGEYIYYSQGARLIFTKGVILSFASKSVI